MRKAEYVSSIRKASVRSWQYPNGCMHVPSSCVVFCMQSAHEGEAGIDTEPSVRGPWRGGYHCLISSTQGYYKTYTFSTWFKAGM